MKKSANSNMYSYAADAVQDLYGSFLDGFPEGLACIVSSGPLGEEAKTALSNSFRKLGYGESPCCFVNLSETGSAPDSLEGEALFALVEALDPYVLVAADAPAAKALSQSYRAPFNENAHGRAFGRSYAAFHSFEDALKSPEGKQRAWALLKKLPVLDR